MQSFFLQHTALKSHDFFVFSLSLFFFSNKKTVNDGEDSEDRSADTVESFHPSQEPTILITGVCVHPSFEWLTQVLAIMDLNIRASQMSDSVSDSFLVTCVILPFPCILSS